MNVNERIEAIRALMAERGMDVYYVPNEDDHLSEEYTADHFKCKSWLSGFSGEAGCTIVTKDFAGLWTDGRYFTQAENELAGSCVELMRMRQAGVPDAMDFLVTNTPEGGVLGFDGRVVSTAAALSLQKALAKKNAKLHVSEDLVGMIWEDRPPMPEEPVYVLDVKYTGETAAERIARVRAEMEAKNADALFLTRLEDPCWLFNIRGNDIACTPVTYAYALIRRDSASYYADEKKVSEDVRAYLNEAGVKVCSFEDLEKDLKELDGVRLWTDLRTFNSYYHSLLKDTVELIDEESPVVSFRAVKNETERNCIRNAHVKDGAAMVQFMKWIKENAGRGLTEGDAEDHLYHLREQQDLYIEPSFGTISAYGENAAMMHYSAREGANALIRPEGFLLVDSGGTYHDGMTDITRTFALGPLTHDEKKYYTLVLKGHVNLARQKFLYGTTGQNLDILARSPLWNLDIDYQCGTGHGVGHVLGVHEGPHEIRWGRPRPGRRLVPLEEGMIVTDEPGVYLPHELGVRIENELLVVKDQENFYGQWMKFETVTYCPYDLDAIDPQYLNADEIAWINSYHRMVYETLEPHLDEQDKKWLKEAVRPLI